MQTTDTILLVRPAAFASNLQTSATNSFQVKTKESTESLNEKATKEFDAFAKKLKDAGVNVLIFDDTPEPPKPDAIFPNNWVTFHADGTVILYPMYALNRQQERRPDIIHSLRSKFIITEILDLSGYEKENRFLEGTGSIVFDHVNKIAYASLSARTDRNIFLEVSEKLDYKPVYFHSYDNSGNEIYHTNVMMCIGEKFAVVCLESIRDETERKTFKQSLADSGHDIIDITTEQMNNFAGNMLAIHNTSGKSLLVLSQRSFKSLTGFQKNGN